MLIVALAMGGVTSYSDNPSVGPGAGFFFFLPLYISLGLYSTSGLQVVVVYLFLFSSSGTLLKLGAKDGHLIRYDLELWRFITPIFLHAGIIHLLFNLLFQLRFGLFMERRWGLLCFVLIYFISGTLCCDDNPSVSLSFVYIYMILTLNNSQHEGLGGNLLSCLIFFNTVSVGASTALMVREHHTLCHTHNNNNNK